MATEKKVILPDIGDFDSVEVIEILVSIGDIIEENNSLITLENDKATMEIPAPFSGKIANIAIKIGDKVSQGDLILTIEDSSDLTGKEEENSDPETTKVAENEPTIVEILVPDLGDFDKVEVIEVLVSEGDEIVKEQGIITLESDKASMEIPSTSNGKVKRIAIKTGDKVGLGDLILELETSTSETSDAIKKQKESPAASIDSSSETKQEESAEKISLNTSDDSHASPSIRKLARELGASLSNIKGTGPKGRILETDLKGYVKQIVAGGSLPEEVESIPLSRIKKISGKHLSYCWETIPHVTQFDEVNIEQMERFRQHQKERGIKLTPLVFIMKAVVQVLKQHPNFNSSLDESGENLLVKKYFNLGVAMDTPEGLVVPVIRDVGKKSLVELADELAEISTRAREGQLDRSEMQGAGFTISSLGGIGGTNFTPIINFPEVAILGVSRTQIKPIWNGESFEPTATLPVALSYDHRVIDGAQGARFIADLNQVLKNIMEILL